MKFTETKLQGVFMVDMEPLADDRGWFSRVYCKDEFKQINHDQEFVQINHSYNEHKATVRGMHYQVEPSVETKLIRCTRGKIFDVIVDIRKGSESFLEWIGVELSSTNKKMIYMPAGFAHGFQTLEDHCELIYHHTVFYNRDAERVIRCDDRMLGIEWPIPIANLSEKDQSYPPLDKNFIGI